MNFSADVYETPFDDEDPGKKKLEESFKQIQNAFSRVATRLEKLTLENAQLREEIENSKKVEKMNIHFEIPLVLNYHENEVHFW